MKKTMFLLYGIVSYLAFLGTILYAIGFCRQSCSSKNN